MLVQRAVAGEVHTDTVSSHVSGLRGGRKDWNWEHASKWWASARGTAASRQAGLEGASSQPAQPLNWVLNLAGPSQGTK